MKDQVTTIEQSRRLEELGVSEEKASMLWFGENDDELAPREAANTLTMHYQGEYLKDTIHYPAFTVADLMEKVIPNAITTRNNMYVLTLEAMVGGGWNVRYSPALTELEAESVGEEVGDNLIALLCDRIEWLVSNGYKLNV